MAVVWAKTIVLGLAVCSCYGHGYAQRQQDLPQPPVPPILSP